MIKWLDRKFPLGLYGGPGRSLVKWCHEHLSLNICVHRHVRRQLSLGTTAKSPRWISEGYQVVAIVFLILLLALARYLPHPWSLVGLVALYRPFEIVLFATAWIFIDTSPIHSYKRSLVGFLINLGEVVLAFASAYLALGCATGIPLALYSSLRTLVTIGPLGTAEPPEHALCGAIIGGQILVAYFLAVIVVGTLVGATRQRGELRAAQREVSGLLRSSEK